MNRIEIFKTNSILSAAFLIAFFAFKLKFLLVMALLLLIGSAFETRIAAMIAKGWLRFADIIGRINSRIILSIVFYLILTPLAILYRLFHKGGADNFRSNKRKSYFDNTGSAYNKEFFEKMW